MKIWLTDGTGVLAAALKRSLQGHDFAGGKPEDVLDDARFAGLILEAMPDIIIHNAELKSGGREELFRWNEEGSRNAALAAKMCGARLFHISAAEVFSGEPPRKPWAWGEMDIPRPQTDYGASKAAGEQMVQMICPEAVIVRTGMVYGAEDGDFIAAARHGGEADGSERINPTSAKTVAEAIRFLLVHPDVSGVVHVASEDQCTAFEAAGLAAELLGTGCEVRRREGAERCFALKKSVLNVMGYRTPKWQDDLREFIREEQS